MAQAKAETTENRMASDTFDLQSAEDCELLSLYALHGDREFLAELVQRHYGAVHNLVARKLICSADIEDALQSTFLVLAQSAHRIRNRNSLAAWLYGVALRICNRIVEKSKRGAKSNVSTDIEATQDQQECPFLDVARRMQLDVLDQELAAVRDAYREVLIEHYLVGKSAPEIAHQFNVSLATIEGRLRRGRAELRSRLLRRGYSFASVLALYAACKTSSSDGLHSLDVITKLVDQLVDPMKQAANDTFDSVRILANEEISMTAYFTSKTSVLVAAGCAIAMVSAMAINLYGYQNGARGSAQAGPTIIAADADAIGANANIPNDGLESNIQSRNDLANQANVVGANQQAVAVKTLPDWVTRPPSDLPAKLGKIEIEPEWHEAPLEQVLQALSDNLEITIWMDEDGLAQVGVNPDHPITMQLPKIQFPQAMDMMLSQFDGGYFLDGDVFVVTSREVANNNPRMQVYDLASLSDSPSELQALQGFLLKDLQRREPELWKDEVWQATPVGKTLLLSCSDILHRKFARDLTKLGHQLGKFKVPVEAVAQTSSNSDSRPRTANAQADPFGSDDPFGSRDPFGDSGATSDPFGRNSESSADPFGQRAKERNSDPFGN